MSKKFSVLFGGLLITLLLIMSLNVTYAAGTPTPTRAPARTATPTRTSTVTPTIGFDLGLSTRICRDSEGNPSWGLDDIYSENGVEYRCQGNDQWWSWYLGQGKTMRPPTRTRPSTEEPSWALWLFAIALGGAFVYGNWPKAKPKPKSGDEPKIPVTIKIKTTPFLSYGQILGLLLVVGIFWGTVTSLNGLFNAAREAGNAWEKAMIATNQAAASAQPSLERDGWLVVLWEVFLKPILKLIPGFGEAFGVMLTLVGTGASFVLGKTYYYIWVGLVWVFKNILIPIGKGIVWVAKLIGAVILTLLGFKSK
ncbi:MAG: hypothetical protein HY515_00440 [Candidatus Aenigmarchaeota archaeon]|nr:hypothetical protein [Candidatus Aenigmarchaeota archaeon]